MNLPVYVVIVAGGSGSRVGTALPKQFLEIAGKPVLYHTLKAFADALPDAHLVLVLPPAQLSYAQMALQHFERGLELSIVAGGATRFHSVQNGLAGIPEDAVVLVHDGVRPLVSKALILRTVAQAARDGSAIPAIPAQDSMRMLVDDGAMSLPINRSNVRIIQTPQGFQASILLPAFRAEYRETFTDEATVVEFSGRGVFFVEGEKENIKITTPADLVIAGVLLRYRTAAAS